MGLGQESVGGLGLGQSQGESAGLLGTLQSIIGESPEEREQNLKAIAELAKGASAMQKGIGAIGQSTIPQRGMQELEKQMSQQVIESPRDPVLASEMLRRLGISGI